MGLAIVNAILSWLSSASAAIGSSISSHTGFWIVAGFFLGKHMPAKIPIGPQDWWTWAREAIQSYISTKEPKDPPPPPANPTQPAPIVPDQKPTA